MGTEIEAIEHRALDAESRAARAEAEVGRLRGALETARQTIAIFVEWNSSDRRNCENHKRGTEYLRTRDEVAADALRTIAAALSPASPPDAKDGAAAKEEMCLECKAAPAVHPNRFCSEACFYTHNGQKIPEPAAEEAKGKALEGRCFVCGDPIPAHHACYWDGSRGAHIACADRWNLSRATPPAAPEPAGALGEDEERVECVTCGNRVPDAMKRGEGYVCVACLDGELSRARAEVERLKNEIGTPPPGSHPDEAKPRDVNWHAERANWAAEVEQLRKVIAERDEAESERDAALSRAEQAEKERDDLRTRLEKALQDRYDALSVYSKDGLLSSEWVARTGKAERESKSAQARVRELEAQLAARLGHPDVRTQAVLHAAEEAADAGANLRLALDRLERVAGGEQDRKEGP